MWPHTSTTSDGDLTFTVQWKRHNNNSWMVEHPVNSIEDLQSVAKIPWHIDGKAVVSETSNAVARAQTEAGDKGILRLR